MGVLLVAPGVAAAAPPLTNDPSCEPDALLHPHNGTAVPVPYHGHPPVILVHGTAIVADQEEWRRGSARWRLR